LDGTDNFLRVRGSLLPSQPANPVNRYAGTHRKHGPAAAPPAHTTCRLKPCSRSFGASLTGRKIIASANFSGCTDPPDPMTKAPTAIPVPGDGGADPSRWRRQ